MSVIRKLTDVEIIERLNQQVKGLEEELAAEQADKALLLQTIEQAAAGTESVFITIGREMGELVSEKNAAYGDSFGASVAFL